MIFLLLDENKRIHRKIYKVIAIIEGVRHIRVVTEDGLEEFTMTHEFLRDTKFQVKLETVGI